MECKQCGAAMGEDEKTCPVCGWEPTQSDVGQVKKSKGPAIALAALLAALVVAAVVIVLCILNGRSGAKEDLSADRVAELTEVLPDNSVDVAMQALGVPGDTVLLTVNGADVTAEEYLYWLGYLTSYYDMMLAYSGEPLDFAGEVEEGLTWDEALKSDARSNAILLALVPGMAEEYGVSLTDDDLQSVADSHAANIEAAGGKEMYAYRLQMMGVSDATALRIDLVSALYEKVAAAWLEQEVAALSDEEVTAYLADHDLLRAKHILISTTDDAGEPLDEAGKAAAKAQADELVAQLRADPDCFDALMAEYSADPGSAAYPDGYLFTAGDMVSEFEDATRALAIGEISEPVESAYGYHIILRLEPNSDSLRQTIVEENGGFGQEVQARVDGAEVVESEHYAAITAAGYYEALSAVQESVPVPDVATVTDQSQVELQPVADDVPQS